MNRFFFVDMPGSRFVRNVLLLSVAALMPVLFLYIALTPGFAPALAAGGPALTRFLRQVVTNGLPVVFAVNYVSLFLFAVTRKPTADQRDTALLVPVDIAVRVVLFPSMHALIYVLSADWFGSFGGSRATALSVVAPTLARSAFFENISGVYLYATMISALALYGSAFQQSKLLEPFVRSMPKNTAFLLLSLFAFALSVGLITIGAQGIASLLN
ncbi:hypothetical protein J7443_18300 [Tropicibacter sp. R15_0]|uniref:hypothetical protein n=1 Tax=Tropicibacter sp. R15_0 TaxID=2821101 RepID=UPI001ADD2769|nr:hypothetical protein [Tropicibacter sp. R15_0]MBO9467200.1 hypothetical protein [Tropicibacter sp. R15_0]